MKIIKSENYKKIAPYYDRDKWVRLFKNRPIWYYESPYTPDGIKKDPEIFNMVKQEILNRLNKNPEYIADQGYYSIPKGMRNDPEVFLVIKKQIIDLLKKYPAQKQMLFHENPPEELINDPEIMEVVKNVNFDPNKWQDAMIRMINQNTGPGLFFEEKK